MKEILEKIENFKKEISVLTDEKNVFDEKNKFNKNLLSNLYLKLKSLEGEKKKELGIQINQYKEKIDEIVNKKILEIKNFKLENIKSEYDFQITSDYFKIGTINPIDLVKNKIIEFFKKANFLITTDSEVTTVEYNFDRLNIKIDHPARSMSDTFYLEKNKLLRVHNTAITSKVLEKFNKNQEIKVLSYGNVYRKDDDDSTHSHQFNQIDVVWVKQNLSIANLKWLTNNLLKFLFEIDVKLRYRLSYFPFTEPSFEIDIGCFFCKYKGCVICKQTKWIEVLGAGLLHNNVLEKAKIDKRMKGIAFGIGIDRIAMLKHRIDDIRRIYINDFELLEEFRGSK